MRALARQDAEGMVPRPRFAVLGLSSPRLESAAIAEYQQVNGVWTSVTLGYGSWEAAAGPYLAVTTAAAEPGLAGDDPGTPGRGLLRAIDAERNRLVARAGGDEEEPAEPPRYSREELPSGNALVCRHGTVWAARLDVAAAVTVTITGRGVDPDEVRLEPVPDLRPLFEARNRLLERLAERRWLAAPAPAALEPAEGVAAFRALAEFTLEENANLRALARRLRRVPANYGGVRSALWQRAVREQQRIAGVDKQAADDVVTSVINHLGHLADEAAWFTADSRLREAAIDETLRHAVLGERVRSLPAQQAWARYWALRMTGREPDPADVLADMRVRESHSASWLTAWAAWAATG